MLPHELAARFPGVKFHEYGVLLNPDSAKIGYGSRIDSFVKLEGGVTLIIGEYVHVASFVHLNVGGGGLIIGDHCFFASGSKVVTGGNKDSGKSMSAVSAEELQAIDRSKTTVFERYSGLLTNAVVLPGITLYEGAVAAAGSVVTCDIPEWEIWGGVPARFMRRRRVGEAVATPGAAPLPVPMDEDWAQRDADLRATNKAGLSHMFEGR